MKFKINTIIVFCVCVVLFLPYFSASVSAQNSYSVTPSKELTPLLPDQPGSIPIILTWDYNVFVMGPAEIALFVDRAKEHNIQQINLRVNNKGVMNVRIKNGTVYTERLDAFGPDFDPLKVLVEEGHKQGIKVAVHFDLFESSYDRFFIDHPQYTPQAERDTVIYNAFPSYAHQETRVYLLNRVRELAEYGIDQMFFCTKSSHTPQNMTEVPRNTYAAYNPPVIKKYEEKYGVNILKEDPEREKVARIHGEYIIDFLKEARDILHEYGVESIAGATLSGYLQPSGKNIYLDWKEIVDQKAADALVMTNTRGETFAWYQKDAPQKFWEILQEVKKNDMKFYAYVLSTVYWHVRDKASWSGLFQFVPKQLEYFYKLGADAVLIHEVYQKELWEVLGNWQYYNQDFARDSKVTIPRVDSLSVQFPHQVPHGGFEEENSHWFWGVVPGWSSIYDWLPDRHTATGLNPDSFQEIWTSNAGSNKHLKAEYDWKVMANSDYSGRSYYGRSSMLMIAEPNAGLQSNRTVSWNASSLVPIVPEDSSIISVWVHGEELTGIEEAGMRITVKDKNNREIDRLEKKQVIQRTFSWRQLEQPYKFPQDAHKIEISLYLTVAPTAETQGRLWFDRFLIQSTEPAMDRALQRREGANAFEGNSYARLQAKPGFEVVSMPFNVDFDKGNILILSMRNPNADTMRVLVKLGGDTSVLNVDREWETYTIPLQGLGNHHLSLTIRPLDAGILDIDGIKLLENNN